jgi:hypothetical protein
MQLPILVAHHKIATTIVVGSRCWGEPIVRMPVHPGQALAGRKVRDVDDNL